MTGVIVGVVALAVLGAGGGGVYVGRAWGRTTERAAQALDALEKLSSGNRARAAHYRRLADEAMTSAQETLAGSDLPPRGSGLPGPDPVVATRTDAQKLLADMWSPLDSIAAHGRAREVPKPPSPIDLSDAYDVYPPDDPQPPPEPGPEPTAAPEPVPVPERGSDDDPPSSGAAYRYQWPSFIGAPSMLQGVMPNRWLTSLRRFTHRPTVHIRRIGGVARDAVQGWAPGEVTTLISGAAALSWAMPTERVLAGKGMHTARRVRREKKLRARGRHRPGVAVGRVQMAARRSLRPDWRTALKPARRTFAFPPPSAGCTP